MTDTCPRCATPGIAPASERKQGGQLIHGYACTCGHRWATARMVEAYPAEVVPPKSVCPTPDKHRYATREAAVIAAERTQVPFGKRLNPYPCKGCGWIHLTSLAAPERYQNTKEPHSAR